MSSGNVRNEVQEKDEAKEREREKKETQGISISISRTIQWVPQSRFHARIISENILEGVLAFYYKIYRGESQVCK